MEAGAATGPAGGDAPADGQQQQADQGPDIASLIGEANAPLQQQVEDMRSFLEQNVPGQQQQEPEPEQPADLSYLDPESPSYDASAAAQQLLDYIGQSQQKAVDPLMQELAQTRTQLQEMQAEQQYKDLAARYPDLEDDAISDRVFKAAGQFVSQLNVPDEMKQQLAASPQILEAAYVMGRSAEAANEEAQQTDPQAATLEGAGGAAAASGGEVFTAESIVKAGGRSVLPI